MTSLHSHIYKIHSALFLINIKKMTATAIKTIINKTVYVIIQAWHHRCCIHRYRKLNHHHKIACSIKSMQIIKNV